MVIGGKVYVAWKRKMLHDVIRGHQAYIQIASHAGVFSDEKRAPLKTPAWETNIQRKKDIFIYGASNFAAG